MDIRIIRKAAAAILAVTVIGGTLPYSSTTFISNSASAESFSESSSTVSFDETTGVLTLSGNVNKKDVTKYKSNSKVKKVIALEGTKLPEDCSNLFAYFKSESIDLSKADTSMTTSMNRMFYSCTNLTDLNISNFDTNMVLNMSEMFKDCFVLPSLDISSLYTLHTENMSWMFSNCQKLTELDVSELSTDNVKDMSYMFHGCIGLESLDISRFNTHNVNSFSHMFEKCKALTSIDVSRLDTSSATNMYGMFSNCTSLTSIDIRNFNTSNVTDMTHMFSNCTNLKEVLFNHPDTSKVNSMAYMFFACGSLEDLDHFELNTSSVKSMKNMFDGCNSLRRINLAAFDTSNVEDMSYMFQSCSSLSELDLRNFNTSKVTNMDHMFKGCRQLRSLDLSSFDTSSVMNMQYMFNLCDSMETVDVSSFNTSNVTNMTMMFYNCSDLKYTDLSHFDMSHVINKNNMLASCDKLNPYKLIAVANNSTLDSSIGLNFFIKINSRFAKAVISGPNGDVVYDTLEGCEMLNGCYKLTYPLNASQGYADVTLKAYDSEGNRLLVVNNDNHLLDHSQSTTNLDRYLDAVNSNTSLSQEIRDLSHWLKTLCVVTDSYFNGTTASYGYPAIDTSDNDIIASKAIKDETGVCKISLVLNSDTAIRIYYPGEENTAKFGDKTLTAKVSKFGKYFEISGIAAHQLSSDYTITIGGKNVTFSGLSYVQRILGNSKADKTLSNIGRMVYAYSRAADRYNNSIKEATT